jgi:trans-AT polyketide synthase/acyltransferase/oxidoreductase domain-containing protein
MTASLETKSLYEAVATLERPCYVMGDERGVTVVSDDRSISPAAQVLAAVPSITPERLGAPGFLRDHGVRYPYMSGAMANGIASASLVVAMARAGFLASFGAAGLVPSRVEEALTTIQQQAPGLLFACNLIHSPHEQALERATVDICLRLGVRCVEASAFLDLTPQVVRYRLAGLSASPSGGVRIANRVIAKVSRPEVAELFLRPAPPHMVRALLDQGLISAEQAALAERVTMADDITAEADSGGHTDRRPLPVLLPEIIALRDRVHAETGLDVRIGAAGGIGTPTAAAAAFAMGAAYVVTGSVNQACVEAGQSESAKQLLAGAGAADFGMAPAADMFELGVDVQVLKRGTMFAARAKRLYELYRAHAGIDDLPPDERASLESRVFQRPLTEIWQDTVRFFEARDPDQINRAENDPKRQLALIFRWYLGLASSWSTTGNPNRLADYQIWCGPAMGAFNSWVAGTPLASLPNRRVAHVGSQLIRGAAFAARITQLRFAGVRLPQSCSTYRPELPTVQE